MPDNPTEMPVQSDNPPLQVDVPDTSLTPLVDDKTKDNGAIIPQADASPLTIRSSGTKDYVFDTAENFDLAQRMAKPLASSDLVPDQYKGNIANCIIALEVAQRMGAPILSVMQNLYIVKGKPGWSSQFIIGAVNNSNNFKALQFRIKKDNKKRKVTYSLTEWQYDPVERKKLPVKITKTVMIKNISCVAYSYDKDGKKLTGPEVSLEMAFKEGWFDKDGSKWQTMPELMLRYRAAAFFGRIYAPEILMGMQTAEEILDVGEIEQEKTLLRTKDAKISDLDGEVLDD